MSESKNELVALVTGGAAGLGREICRQLAARECQVAIADQDTAGAQQTLHLCAASKAIVVKVDLGEANGPTQMVVQTVERFGRLDVLINCAAFATAESFIEMTAEGWEKTLLVNVRGIALAMSAAAKVMISAKRGRIINVTSPASRMALPNYAAYAASKAAVDSLTRSAAVALAPHQIQVNSVVPGMMNTDMQIRTEELFAKLEGQTDIQKFLDSRTARIPLGYRTTVEEVAGSIVWLALDAPAYIVAERLNISGGLDKD